MKRKEYIDATMKAQRTVPLGEVAAEVKRVLDKQQKLKGNHETFDCDVDRGGPDIRHAMAVGPGNPEAD